MLIIIISIIIILSLFKSLLSNYIVCTVLFHHLAYLISLLSFVLCYLILNIASNHFITYLNIQDSFIILSYILYHRIFHDLLPNFISFILFVHFILHYLLTTLSFEIRHHFRHLITVLSIFYLL